MDFYLKRCSTTVYLEAAEDRGNSSLQVIPALVTIVGHLPQSTGSISAVLACQSSVLLVDQLQLGQALMHLPLESL